MRGCSPSAKKSTRILHKRRTAMLIEGPFPNGEGPSFCRILRRFLTSQKANCERLQKSLILKIHRKIRCTAPPVNSAYPGKNRYFFRFFGYVGKNRTMVRFRPPQSAVCKFMRRSCKHQPNGFRIRPHIHRNIHPVFRHAMWITVWITWKWLVKSGKSGFSTGCGDVENRVENVEYIQRMLSKCVCIRM